jgi:hypothetical protein
VDTLSNLRPVLYSQVISPAVSAIHFCLKEVDPNLPIYLYSISFTKINIKRFLT